MYVRVSALDFFAGDRILEIPVDDIPREWG